MIIITIFRRFTSPSSAATVKQNGAWRTCLDSVCVLFMRFAQPSTNHFPSAKKENHCAFRHTMQTLSAPSSPRQIFIFVYFFLVSAWNGVEPSVESLSNAFRTSASMRTRRSAGMRGMMRHPFRDSARWRARQIPRRLGFSVSGDDDLRVITAVQFLLEYALVKAVRAESAGVRANTKGDTTNY